MSLFIYLSKLDDAGFRLQRIIGNLNCQDSIEIFYTFDGFEFRVKTSFGNGDIALILASTLQDLNALVANRELFYSLKVVLIVPDRRKETISKGHLFRPRYLSFRDSNFSDVAQVLQKLFKIASQTPHLTQSEVHTPRGGF
jgi:hypothetical protein